MAQNSAGPRGRMQRRIDLPQSREVRDLAASGAGALVDPIYGASLGDLLPRRLGALVKAGWRPLETAA